MFASGAGELGPAISPSGKTKRRTYWHCIKGAPCDDVLADQETVRLHLNEAVSRGRTRSPVKVRWHCAVAGHTSATQLTAPWAAADLAGFAPLTLLKLVSANVWKQQVRKADGRPTVTTPEGTESVPPVRVMC